tara:strand:- start:1032 stop:1241 length:210 start_codon:yes stop_codon:yes gene_type:complete
MTHDLDGVFTIKNNGKLVSYNNYQDLPDSFDHLIAFHPEVPPPPHNEEVHTEMGKWSDYLQELMKRETK